MQECAQHNSRERPVHQRVVTEDRLEREREVLKILVTIDLEFEHETNY